ncbi:YcaO-type kinase domain-containing protein [Desulfocicer vacuolatum DSM 3385]|uniref:YcaO-type kinase domain-containing protein n=1 Tax=Desulfocicer vacuolatum DSM 3385 TaxID=1121400 RepID=A0A1W2DBZ5_9BACT|nr:YcaO-like family protein [Desulfocicer vacuolatum]SMC94528.1 YcaO-type kinase domain-containing protein [Desulfocicer vacuolatum DSM 3385]
MAQPLSYTLTLKKTKAAAGYFQAVPENFSHLDEMLAALQHAPMDSFLHKCALDLVAELAPETLDNHILQATKNNNFILLSLICEHLLLSRGRGKIRDYFSDQEVKELSTHSPLIHLRSVLEPNRRLHTQWIRLFRENIMEHADLPSLGASGLPPICSGECRPIVSTGLEIKKIHKNHLYSKNDTPRFSAEKTTETALERLASAGVFLEQEMRHQSSLSPIALLRKWRFKTSIENKRHSFYLGGTQTSYGKGLTLEDARASLSMEIVERCASFASVSNMQVLGTRKQYPLIQGPWSTLIKQGKKAINPQEITQEITYRDEPLHWIEGEQPGIPGPQKIWLPVQALFLFLNLDEIDLFSGLGSTGLASGNTLAQAKVSALLEVVERHQEGTVPFDPASCFRLVAREERLAALLDSQKNLGIDVLFQDITPPSGIPCCKCFVKDVNGVIHKGTAAHLNARKAIVSALTETPYPFPQGPPSLPFNENFTLVGYENLPDFTTGSPKSDLNLLENLLISQNKTPVYVELTRKDMKIPVVRAIVPGMEIMGDFDQFSRVHPDLFHNYLVRENQ